MYELDQSLFTFINLKMTNPFFDWLMPLVTDLHKNTVFIAFFLPTLLIFWLYKGRSKALLKILTLALMLGTLDNFNHRILKKSFQRERPPLVEREFKLRAPHHNGYSFPSNHAANNFAGATFLSYCYPALSWPLFLVASTIAFSRVYVGVHYPFDVLAGALVGIIFGFSFFRVFVIIQRRILGNEENS